MGTGAMVPAVLLWLAGGGTLVFAGEEWRPVRSEDGYTLEKRAVAGEKFEELRMRTVVRGTTPEKIVTFLLGGYLEEVDAGVERRFVHRSDRTVEWTDRVRSKLVGERCATIRMTVAESGGEMAVSFQTTGEWPVGKPAEDCVPLRTRGMWLLRRAGPEQTEVTYTVFTDVGGLLPAFLVRGAIVDDTWNRTRRALREAAR